MWTLVHWASKVRFRCCSSHVPNLTDELRMAKEWHLNQFWCGKSLKFNSLSNFVKLNLCLTHGGSSESDVAPVLLQRRTYSIRFGTWKVWHLNQAKLQKSLAQQENFLFPNYIVHCTYQTGLLYSPDPGHAN